MLRRRFKSVADGAVGGLGGDQLIIEVAVPSASSRRDRVRQIQRDQTCCVRFERDLVAIVGPGEFQRPRRAEIRWARCQV